MTWHAHLDSFTCLLPGRPTATYPEGVPFRTAMASGTMSVELFAPKGPDRQQPHEQDELYVVAAGTGVLVREEERVRAGAGTVLFVPARVAHHFEDFSDDFATWVVFWGPKGGEERAPDLSPFGRAVVAPTRLLTPDFVLEPLAPRHNEPDHAAWSSSIDHIRATPGFVPHAGQRDPWPYPMSLEDNLADLERHAQEFASGTGFAYTVLDRADGDVIGCVYIRPDETGEADARCTSWVRADRAPLDGVLHGTLAGWLNGPAWPFTKVRFPGRQ